MGHFSDNPVLDAQVYFRSERTIEPIIHKCCSCHKHFEEGSGVIIDEEEKFCKKCHNSSAQIKYYRDLDLNEEEITELIKKYKPI